METKICAACGQPFGCGRHDPTCWCASLPALPAASLAPDTDCYCPACLEQRCTRAGAGQAVDEDGEAPA